jgi:hypothetical protein
VSTARRDTGFVIRSFRNGRVRRIDSTCSVTDMFHPADTPVKRCHRINLAGTPL